MATGYEGCRYTRIDRLLAWHVPENRPQRGIGHIFIVSVCPVAVCLRADAARWCADGGPGASLAKVWEGMKVLRWEGMKVLRWEGIKVGSCEVG